MKKMILAALFIAVPFICFSQEKAKEPIVKRDKSGIIQSVEFPDSILSSIIPTSSNAFFKDFLEAKVNDEFRKIPRKEKKKEFIHEHFDQYYKGIKIDDAGYNFHYKNGKMFYAHGHYVKVDDLEVTPTVTPEKAKDCFANYIGIPTDSVADFIAELIIKEITIKENDSVLLPKLVYRIYLYANYENNTEIGFIDAHTCEILLTEPALIGYSATGTFATRYSGSRQGITHSYSGAFHLADSTRGAIIHTWNLNGNTNFLSVYELSDNDNNWTSAEHSASENDMGLDVHWALQQIYDLLNNVHGINSFNDSGYAIDAYIHYGTINNDRDNSGWNPTLNVLVFGDGAVVFRPIACLDAVAHEFGHGITDFQIGWPYSGDRAAFHEGMSDIWGVIFENRIRPNSIWQIGEQITIHYGCLRNIHNTNDPNAMQTISDTYLSAQYNSGNNYVRSGVLSHWFYLLVNGGSGTNGVGNAYTVYGMGIDIAENLIIEAVYNSYLNGITTYPDLRTSMVNAATALCGSNSLLVRQVENAWYAVGVGTQPTQVTLTGPTLVCNSGTNFTVNNLPTGCTINWTYSSNLQAYYGGSNFVALRAIGNGSGWVRATINSSCGQIILPQKDVWVGVPSTPTSILGFCCNGMEFGSESIYEFTVNHANNQSVNQYNWVVAGGTILEGQGTKTITVKTAKVTGSQRKYFDVSIRVANSCGWSSYLWRSGYVTSGAGPAMFSVYPNPANNEVTISFTDSFILPETDSTNEVASVSDVKIYDSFGTIKIIKRANFYQKPITINISELQKGTYMILINCGKVTESHILIIE